MEPRQHVDAPTYSLPVCDLNTQVYCPS